MKKLYATWLLLLILSLTTIAQPADNKPFELDKLQQQDTQPTGWKIQQGNNPLWALPAFDDTKWAGFDPSQNIDALRGKGNNFWMRLHLKVDSSLKTSDFGLMVNQFAASVIYLDGRLIKKLGDVAATPKYYNPLGEPIPVKLSAGDHLIAVQITVCRNPLGFRASSDFNTFFYFAVNSYPAAKNNYDGLKSDNQQFVDENLLLIGMFFILTVTHLLSFCYYPKQRAHLYYSFVTFILLIDTYINIVALSEHSPVMIFWYNIIGLVGFSSFIFLPLTIYALFDYSRRWPVKIILTFSLLSLLFFWINTDYAINLFFIAVPLVNAIECLRIGIWALRRKKNGALFIVAGSFLFLSLFVIQNLVTGLLGQVLFMLSLTSLPIGMTVFLAIRTAITYRSLETKLVEVQDLSNQNMQHQLDKQQILAGQNERLEQQVDERTAELNRSLINLKSTQNQLIQAEKMASLGELTAGIAHEIQNPLNFVNNFSEVSVELLDEMDEELDKGDIQEAKTIGADLKQNLQKIQHHGKRAEFIVKGMLEHSRTSTGEKQLTDINVLCDEFLKLSYHGLRAKDKSFNAEMTTHFDPNLPKINVSQQDIGRVMLNLFNNAFYAVNQKLKTAGPGYKPTVEVTTFTPPSGGLGVKVKDNGVGIPDAIKEKIMQPFFTTKPTGEGTGLGLSLTYDMVVKGHSGKIDVLSKEGEFTEFTVSLPL